ncbi:MAG: hypothetical protein ACJA0G_001054 [Kangiellaceae bacterium]|jgi:hypothetical protein
MASIYPMTQSLFVNRQPDSAQQPLVKDINSAVEATTKLSPIEGEFFKIGDSVSFSQAENLFERANQYAQLTTSAQNGLQIYTAIDTGSQREELRRLMGVDLYA